MRKIHRTSGQRGVGLGTRILDLGLGFGSWYFERDTGILAQETVKKFLEALPVVCSRNDHPTGDATNVKVSQTYFYWMKSKSLTHYVFNLF